MLGFRQPLGRDPTPASFPGRSPGVFSRIGKNPGIAGIAALDQFHGASLDSIHGEICWRTRDQFLHLGVVAVPRGRRLSLEPRIGGRRGGEGPPRHSRRRLSRASAINRHRQPLLFGGLVLP